MAEPRCPQSDCYGSEFEMKQILVKRGTALFPNTEPEKMLTVQCAKCGTVVTILPSLDIPHYILGIADHLGVK